MRRRDACSSASRASDSARRRLVLERDGGRRADRLEQLGVVVERRVVDDRRDLPPAAVDPGDRPLAARLGQGDGRAVRVDERAAGTRVGDDEVAVAEHLGEPRLQRPPAHRRQAGEQVRQPAARQPRAQQAREERAGHEQQRQHREPDEPQLLVLLHGGEQ